MAQLTPAQKKAFIDSWTPARQAASKIIALSKKYDVSSFRDAVAAVDDAIPKFRAGTMSDDDFVSLIDATLVNTGDLVMPDGTLVVDSGGPDADLINAYASALPNYSSALTVTTETDPKTGKKKSVVKSKVVSEPTWKKYMIPGIIGFAVLLVAIAAIPTRRNQENENPPNR